jgi:hypothetical protein
MTFLPAAATSFSPDSLNFSSVMPELVEFLVNHFSLLN